MDRYCLRTKLVEKPSVCLYFKGFEGDNSIPKALDVVVAFAPADAQDFCDDEAAKLCKKLNEDRETLIAHGFREFEVIKKANSD